jgi:hypothetical protein
MGPGSRRRGSAAADRQGCPASSGPGRRLSRAGPLLVLLALQLLILAHRPGTGIDKIWLSGLYGQKLLFWVVIASLQSAALLLFHSFPLSPPSSLTRIHLSPPLINHNPFLTPAAAVSARAKGVAWWLRPFHRGGPPAAVDVDRNDNEEPQRRWWGVVRRGVVRRGGAVRSGGGGGGRGKGGGKGAKKKDSSKAAAPSAADAGVMVGKKKGGGRGELDPSESEDEVRVDRLDPAFISLSLYPSLRFDVGVSRERHGFLPPITPHTPRTTRWAPS